MLSSLTLESVDKNVSLEYKRWKMWQRLGDGNQLSLSNKQLFIVCVIIHSNEHDFVRIVFARVFAQQKVNISLADAEQEKKTKKGTKFVDILQLTNGDICAQSASNTNVNLYDDDIQWHNFDVFAKFLCSISSFRWIAVRQKTISYSRRFRSRSFGILYTSVAFLQLCTVSKSFQWKRRKQTIFAVNINHFKWQRGRFGIDIK